MVCISLVELLDVNGVAQFVADKNNIDPEEKFSIAELKSLDDWYINQFLIIRNI